MPVERRPLKPRTLKESAASARMLRARSLTDKNPAWGDEQLRRELDLYARTLDWARRAGKDPFPLIVADEVGRRRKREKEAAHVG